MLSLCSLGSVVEAQDRAPHRSALGEIVVTATGVETDVQTTPLSVAVLTGEQLDLAGIDAGRDLGLRIPNAVFSPLPNGERASAMVVRGLPGVETYIDGVWFGGFGFQQRNFVELDRVEVLRGPQGTHFGRNTNGGAIQIVTRPPASQFGTRVEVEAGELDRRALEVAADVPISDRLQTKWVAAHNEVGGFLDNEPAGFALGDERDTLLRGDVRIGSLNGLLASASSTADSGGRRHQRTETTVARTQVCSLHRHAARPATTFALRATATREAGHYSPPGG